jgi:hypothetical protein
MVFLSSVLRPLRAFPCPVAGLPCNAEAMQGYPSRLTLEKRDIGSAPSRSSDPHSRFPQ